MSFGMIMWSLNKVKKQIVLYGFIVRITIDEIYKYIAEDVERRFVTSNYELDSSLPKGKNEKVIGLMKDELGRKTMTKFVG